MSDWKTAYRSFYYETAPPPEDIVLSPAKTALLVIDIQNTYMEIDPDPDEAERWAPFRKRMNETVIPNTARMIRFCREQGIELLFDVNSGVCHQVMVDHGLVYPGMILIATDSHTTTHGALVPSVRVWAPRTWR